jgi:hypothetical protein
MYRNLKFYLVLVLVIVLAVFVGTSCSKAASADLSGIALDGAQIGDSLNDINVDKYTLSDRFPVKENTVNFEQWRVTTDENSNITSMFAVCSEVELSIDSDTDYKMIDNVTNTLGGANETWYDREQNLKGITYTDRNYSLQATFVFDDRSKAIIWVILSRLS